MDDFKELKELLLADEKKEIHTLQERLENPQLRAQDISQVLPDAIHLCQNNPKLSKALQVPVTESIAVSVRQNRQSFADALFPIMGPAIRHSITESLRAMMQSINQTLDQSFSLRGLSWRVEAMRSGLPFHEVVMSHTLLFSVEQVFLIQRGSGLLIQQVSKEHVVARDADSVSSMLSAIVDFVQDSFNRDLENEGLDTIDVGEHTVWILYGPQASLACVIRGIAPLTLRERFTGVLESIHLRFGKILQTFDGDTTGLEEIQEDLRECLISEQKTEAGKKRPSTPFIILMVLLVLGGIAWGYISWREQQRFSLFVQDLKQTPGIMVTSAKGSGGRYEINGLRDPLAPATMDIAQRHGFGQQQLLFQWQPYQALHPGIIEARAQQLLEPPSSVTLTFEKGVLHAEGVAPQSWISRTDTLARALPGIQGYDGTELINPDQILLTRARESLALPAQIKMTSHDGLLHFQGEAPQAWITSLEARTSALKGLRGYDATSVKILEAEQLIILVAQINNTSIYFKKGLSQIAEGQEEKLENLEINLHKSLALAKLIDRGLDIRITGYTDGVGKPALNQLLSHARAQAMAEWMAARDIVPQYLSIYGSQLFSTGAGDPDSRRVNLHVQIIEEEKM